MYNTFDTVCLCYNYPISFEKRNRDYLVFLFEYSNELLADLDKITFNK